MTRFILPLFIAVMLVQWLVPGQMIWKHENILDHGKVWRFQVEPIDPVDPFRGRYITLNFEEDAFHVSSRELFVDGEEVYVLIANGKDGFAKIKGIARKKPSGISDYVKARIRYSGGLTDPDSTYVSLTYPFEALYMDEFKAPKAGEVYIRSTADSTKKTWATVKVLHGDPVLENVYIDNVPIGELLKEDN